MTLFPFTKDLQAFLLRVTASLDGFDDAVRDARVLMKNANEAVTEIRQAGAAVRAGLKEKL